MPDLRDAFIRGKSAIRTLGDVQQESFGTHTHTAGSLSIGYTDVNHSHPADFVKI